MSKIDHLPCSECLVEPFRLIGQEHINHEIRNSLLAHRKVRSPLVFLLLGPPGLGKSKTAQLIAEQVFQSPIEDLKRDNKFKEFSMAAYKSEHAISSFIGTPDGIKGDERGQLFKFLDKNRRSVVLLDEIDKSHAAVFDVLFPLFEKGELSNARHDATIQVPEAIFVLTGNHLTDVITEKADHLRTHEQMQEFLTNEVQNELTEKYSQGFVRRVKPLAFLPLTDKAKREAIACVLKEYCRMNLKEYKQHIEWSPEVEQWSFDNWNEKHGVTSVNLTKQKMNALIASTPSSSCIYFFLNKWKTLDVIYECFSAESLNSWTPSCFPEQRKEEETSLSERKSDKEDEKRVESVKQDVDVAQGE